MAIRHDLANHLRNEEPLPVYAILSADAFLRSEAVSHRLLLKKLSCLVF